MILLILVSRPTTSLWRERGVGDHKIYILLLILSLKKFPPFGHFFSMDSFSSFADKIFNNFFIFFLIILSLKILDYEYIEFIF